MISKAKGKKPSAAVEPVISREGMLRRGRSGDGVRDAENGGATCRDLIESYRAYCFFRKCRIQLENRTRVFIASAMGYRGKDTEDKERKRLFKAADEIVKATANAIKALEKAAKKADQGPPSASAIAAEVRATATDFSESVIRLVVPVVITSLRGGKTWSEAEAAHSDFIERLAASLPIADWVRSQKGLGIGNVARILGECGDLSNYANPAKVWKRMGLAPYQGKMPATWRSKGGLPAGDWVAIGYSPRRRSVMWNVGESLLKGNGDGEYRRIYERTKADFKKRRECSDGHAHNHGLLMMEKEVIKRLWCAWNNRPVIGGERSSDFDTSRPTDDRLRTKRGERIVVSDYRDVALTGGGKSRGAEGVLASRKTKKRRR